MTLWSGTAYPTPSRVGGGLDPMSMIKCRAPDDQPHVSFLSPHTSGCCPARYSTRLLSIMM